MQIFCDLDSVIVDFSGGCEKIFPNYAKDHKPLNDMVAHLDIAPEEFWKTIDSYGEEWWANLEAEEWANELVDIIKFYDRNFTILTSPSRSHYAASGKVLWLQKFFHKKFSNYIITPAKNKQLLAHKKAVLIDDNDKNCEQFRSRLGYTVVFPRIWNENHKLENQKIEYTKKHLDLISKYI